MSIISKHPRTVAVGAVCALAAGGVGAVANQDESALSLWQTSAIRARPNCQLGARARFVYGGNPKASAWHRLCSAPSDRHDPTFPLSSGLRWLLPQLVLALGNVRCCFAREERARADDDHGTTTTTGGLTIKINPSSLITHSPLPAAEATSPATRP